MARMMSRFPSYVNRYTERNSPKGMGCNLCSSEIPRSRHSDICVLFFGPMWFTYLTKKGDKRKGHDLIMQ
jgi:hypothetical protein